MSATDGLTLLRQALARCEDGTPWADSQMMGTGSGHRLIRVKTERRLYCFKWNARPAAGMFLAEAQGLRALAETRSVRVPQVFAADQEDDGPGWILMEWIETGQWGEMNWEGLGESLAQMHAWRPAEVEKWKYGFFGGNYLGTAPQRNTWDADWVRFFAEQRLGFQRDWAAQNGCLPPERARCLDWLITHLGDFLGGVPRQPALLHGDLWGGNVLSARAGTAVLIDPAVYYGDREAEIAFTKLFGGFSARFYQAYQSTQPLDPGFHERVDLYNLYHLLNHLNLFGEGYGGAVDAVLHRYVGLTGGRR